MADFDVQAARKAGYSDAEIADYLAGSMKFDAAAARQAGYGDKEIIDHLAPGPGMVRRALNAVGDTVKAVDDWGTTRAADAAGALVGLPRVGAQGVEWLYKQAGINPASIWGEQGAKVLSSMTEHPSGEQISADILAAGKKTPTNLPGPLGKIVDTGVEGALGALATGGTSLPAMLAGALGGAGSEIGGQLAEGTSYEIPARLAGAVLGGVGGAVTPSAARKVANAVKAPVAPFTAAGQEKILGAALRDTAADPDAAIAGLNKYTIGREAFPDTVPGFKIDAGKASRDPGLMAAAEVQPSGVRGLNVQNNNRVLSEALDNATAGMPPAADAGSVIQKTLADRFRTLNEARSNAATPLYEAARNFPEDLPVGKLFQYADDVIAANKGEPKAVMEAARKLLFNAKGEPDFSARGLMAAREGLGGLFTPTLDNHSRSLLKGLQTRIDETLQSIPEAAAGRAKYAEMSVPLESFGKKTLAAKVVETDPITKKFVLPEGQVLSDLKTKDVQNILMASGGDPTVKRNIASLYLDDFKNSVGNAVQQDATGRPMLGAYPAAKWMDTHRGAARNVLSGDQIRALDDITKHLGDQAQSIPGRTGSPTFDRLASESILKAVIGRKEVPAWLHPVQKALTLNGIIDIYGGANKQMLDRMLEVIADPAATAALMKKATPGNVKLAEPLLQSIARGTAYPAVTSGERGSP